jgi:hypothetical protein
VRRDPVPGWRSRRRRENVSHWPPAQSSGLTELLGGVNRRRLTRAQREEIAGLIEHGADLGSPEFRAAVRQIRGVQSTE